MSLVDKIKISALALGTMFSTSLDANDALMQEYLTKSAPKDQVEYVVQDENKEEVKKIAEEFANVFYFNSHIQNGSVTVNWEKFIGSFQENITDNVQENVYKQ